ncbi:hypothetical protein D3C76_891800 [compost metagenome]
MSAPNQFSFFKSLISPTPCHYITTYLAFRDQVHRDHSKLCACSTLHEQYLIALRIAEERKQTFLRFIMHGFVNCTTVRHLHDRHSTFPEINKLRLCAFQYRKRQCCRSGIKIVCSLIQNYSPPFLSYQYGYRL